MESNELSKLWAMYANIVFKIVSEITMTLWLCWNSEVHVAFVKIMVIYRDSTKTTINPNMH